MGEIEQPVVVEAEQRALEDRCQGQVVLRQQQEIRDGEHVHDRQLLGQHHAVGAGDRNGSILERADQRVDQGVAPAHQNHDVAGARRALHRFAAGAVPDQAGRSVEPGAHLPGDPVRQALGRRGRLGVDFRRRPHLRFRRLVRGDDRPQFDHAALALPPCGMAQRRARPDNAIAGRTLGEAAVHRVQHLLDRTEGHVEFDRRPVLPGGPHPVLEIFAHPVEHDRVGALEAEDRLLDITDGEHGARRPGQAVVGRGGLDSRAGEELLRDRLDQAPLLRAGVLRFVHQDVVDAAVQLVEHPFGRRLAGQQVLGLQDQVVEIENGAPPLLRLVTLVDRRAEPGQRRAPLHDRQRLFAVVQGGEPGGFLPHDVEQARQRVGGLLRRRAGIGLPVRLQKCAGIVVETFGPRRVSGGQPAGDFRRLPGVRRTAVFQRPRRLREPIAVEPPFGAGLGVERRLARAGVEAGIVVEPADRRRYRRPVLQEVAQPPALAQELAEQCGEIVRPAERREQRQFFGIRAAAGFGIGQHPVAHAVQQGALVAFLDNPEVGRHAGLQREALEQGLAEGVDRLDAHAARHVQAGREQGAGARRLGRDRRPAGYLLQILAQRRPVHQRPAAEPGRDPVDHLRRRGLGEGEAQDARRGGAVQQQPQDAPGQHMGLARAGAGAGPGRDLRFRGPALRALGDPLGIRRRLLSGRRGHGSASTSAHSRMRARCS